MSKIAMAKLGLIFVISILLINTISPDQRVFRESLSTSPLGELAEPISTSDLPAGYWIARSPITTTDGFGQSFPRKYLPNIGNGYDFGVMWRPETLDNNGETIESSIGEERHCGAWVEYMFDEPDIDSGKIDQIYCHTWIYSSSLNSVSIGLGANGYGFNYYTNTWWNNLYAKPGVANKFNLGIYYNDIPDISFSKASDFFDMSITISGLNIQTISYPNQRSFCIINSFNGIKLSDIKALDKSDYDKDRLSDYKELFITFSDPTLADTDKDGNNDYLEYISGTKAWDPNDIKNINIYKLDGINSQGYIRTKTRISDVYQINILDKLDRELTQSEYTQISNYDNSFVALSSPLSSKTLIQANYQYSIPDNINNIKEIIIFFGGSASASVVAPTYKEFNRKIYSLSGKDYVFTGGINSVDSLNYIKINSNLADVIINGKLSFTTYYIAKGSSYGSLQFNLDNAEVWVIS